MRILKYFTIIFCVGLPLITQAQLVFQTNGKLSSPFVHSVGTSATFTMSVTQPAVPAADIKKKLIYKLRNTIENLTKPEAAAFYSALWSENDYQQLLDGARNWLHYLETNTDSTTYYFYPPQADLKTNIFNNNNILELLPPDYDSRSEIMSEALVKNDVFKTWLVNMFNSDITGRSFINLEPDKYYQRDWEELDKLLPDIKIQLSQVQQIQLLHPYSCTNNDDLLPIQNFYSTRNIASLRTRNGVLNRFSSEPIYKKWLWYCEGELRSNPLGFNSPEKRYVPPQVDEIRAKMFDDLVEEQIKKMKDCCGKDPKEIESLVIAFKTGKKKFLLNLPDPIDEIFQLKSLDDLQKARTIVNDMKFVVDADPKVTKKVIEMDGANKFSFDKASVPEFIDDKTKVIVVAHNVPAGSRIYIESKPEAHDGLSPAQKSFSEFVGGIATTITALSGNAGLFAKIAGAFSAPKATVPNFSIPAPDAAEFTRTGGGHLPAPFITNFRVNFNNNFFTNSDWTDAESIAMPTSKEFIRGYFRWRRGPFDPAILNWILNNCILPNLDYKTNAQCNGCYEQSIRNLIKELNRLVTLNVNRANSISAIEPILNNLSIVLSGLTEMKDRSIPPGILQIKNSDKVPLYSSQIPEFEMPEGAKVIPFNVMEAKPKPGGGEKDSVRTLLTHQKITQDVYKWYLFSAGLGVDLSDYTSNIASGNPVTVTSKSQTARIIAGINIYPFKYFAQSKSFLGFTDDQFKHRFSIFLGLGIPDPLKNFCPALSLDLLPGFKFNVGAHLYTNYKYKINNNQIVETTKGLKYGGIFLGLTMEPASFIKSIGLFK